MKEEQLWIKLLQGDMNALESIYRSYVQILYDYGTRISDENEIVEDCIHNLFADIWLKRKKLQAAPNVKAYLMLALRRRIIRQLSSQKRVSSIDNNQYLFKTETDIQEQHIDQESRTIIQKKLKLALEKLTDQQREMLYLRFQQNLKSKEIAQILGMKDQSVRNAIHRAIMKLRELMVFALLLSTIMLLMYLILK
jgi:RNA polymerase sigma factor (sigma-70 family)